MEYKKQQNKQIQVIAEPRSSLIAILGYEFSSKPVKPMNTRHGHEHLSLLLVDKQFSSNECSLLP
jgi:hypothetical protein